MMAKPASINAPHDERANPPRDIGENNVNFEKTRLSWVWWILVLATAAAALGAGLLTSTQIEDAARESYDLRRQEVISSIRDRMNDYEQVLRGGVGLTVSNEAVSRTQWKTYVDELKIEENYPGIQAIGYSVWVPSAEISNHIRKVRAEGFPDYTLRPEGPRERYTSIIYIEPFDERNRQAFGYDMYSQETRREAMRRAVETGETFISGRVTLVQEIDADVQAGFLMYLPHYRAIGPSPTVEDRWAASVGFVYGAFRMRDLMNGVVGNLEDIGLEIYDSEIVSNDTLMYRSFNSEVTGQEFTNAKYASVEKISITGVTWTVRIASLNRFEKQFNQRVSLIVFAIGGLIAFLVGCTVWAFHSTRTRAAEMATRMVASLQARTEALRKTNLELEEFAYRTSHDLRSPIRSSLGLVTICEESLDHRNIDEAKQSLGHIKTAMSKLDGLIKDIHEIVRADKVEPKKQLVDVPRLVGETLKSLSHMEGFDAVDIRLDVEDGLALTTDKERLRVIVGNLVSNAVKYQDPSKPSPFLEIAAHQDGSTFKLSISDNGIGIPPDRANEVFSMFKRFHPRISYGSGLGLYILKKSVDILGGDIRYEPTDNGSLFQFQLANAFESTRS